MALLCLDASHGLCYNGIRAAHAAGAHPIMVPDILQPDEEIREKAEVVLPSLFEVKEYLEKQE